jgi:amidase
MKLPRVQEFLRLDAAEIVTRLARGDFTTTDLVSLALEQIRKQNKNGIGLNAFISIASETELLQQAAQLDSERRSGNVRGPLHGIPIVLKVCVASGSK